ncbi:MAG: hypothetical protein AAGC88_14310 [Bacteroidota bacterium]
MSKVLVVFFLTSFLGQSARIKLVQVYSKENRTYVRGRVYDQYDRLEKYLVFFVRDNKGYYHLMTNQFGKELLPISRQKQSFAAELSKGRTYFDFKLTNQGAVILLQGKYSALQRANRLVNGEFTDIIYLLSVYKDSGAKNLDMQRFRTDGYGMP